MKKALISFVTLVLLASVTILFINAAGSDKERKNRKANTEMEKDCGKCIPAVSCKMSAESKKVSCDPVKCKEMNCDKKEAKCNPANCPKHGEVATTEMKGCCGAKSEAGCTGSEKGKEE